MRYHYDFVAAATQAAGIPTMFYFFQRDNRYVRCEIRQVAGSEACELAISEQGLDDRIERYPNWDAAHARWQSFQDHLRTDGWTGPLGRE
jgi:hypothetical protein